VGAFSAHALESGGGLFDAIAAMSQVGQQCLATSFCMWCQDTFVWYGATAQRKLREAYFVAIVTPSIKHLRKELAKS